MGGEELRRSYSVCVGVPDYEASGELRVAIKRVAGGRFSNWANDTLRAGREIDVMSIYQMYQVHLQDYDLDTTHQITRAPKDLIVRWARDSGTIKPAAMHNGEGVCHYFHMTEMGRAWVQFNKAQKDMIKAMFEAGDIAGGQAIILKELEVQAGGAAEAAGKTMAGQMDILKNTLGNVKEEIGGALIPILKALVSWLGPKMVAGLHKFSTWFRVTLVDVQRFIGKVGNAQDILVI